MLVFNLSRCLKRSTYARSRVVLTSKIVLSNPFISVSQIVCVGAFFLIPPPSIFSFVTSLDTFH